MPPVLADRKAEVAAAAGRMSPRGGLTGHSSFSCRAGSIQGPADETYPNCVNGLPYLRDKDSLPTDSVQFALTETRSSILDTTEPIPESVHQRIIAQDALVTKGSEIVANRLVQTPR